MVHEKHERHEKIDGEILYRDECYQIQGAVFEVYREMGCGFLEAVYQECMGKELSKRGIPFTAHPELSLSYKGEPLRQTYIPDFICYDSIIIELKALAATTGEHKAQIMNYLKAIGMRLGLLVNFGCHPKATIERIVL
jgi:GxxExxY protein